MLRTKAMREKEEAKAKRKYKYCLMRLDSHVIFNHYLPLYQD